jgi:hypothetical protein
MVKMTLSQSSRILALAAALAVAGVGCKSKNERTVKVNKTANSIDQNRLLVRMALAENVYNGIAAERAVYPKDFEPGSTKLTTLGENRIETLIHICRDGNSRIVVIRGDESPETYDARVKLVEEQFVDAGFDTKITVAKDSHVTGGGQPSDRAILTYSKMMTSYQPGQTQAAPIGGTGFRTGN